MACERWQPWERLFLHEVGSTMPIDVIAEKLERSESAIQSKAAEIGVTLISRIKGKPWTTAEIFLFGRFSAEEIAIATGRSIFSVRSMRYKLSCKSGGMIIPEWTTEQISLLLRHSNEEVADITGRSIEEVGDKRLQVNVERNGWDVKDPERAG